MLFFSSSKLTISVYYTYTKSYNKYSALLFVDIKVSRAAIKLNILIKHYKKIVY